MRASQRSPAAAARIRFCRASASASSAAIRTARRRFSSSAFPIRRTVRFLQASSACSRSWRPTGPLDAAQFYELLNGITVLAGLDGQLTEILQEEAAGYFAGSMTAEQAARNIQSRASLYLQEHRRA